MITGPIEAPIGEALDTIAAGDGAQSRWRAGEWT
jgi:hypothetical protein